MIRDTAGFEEQMVTTWGRETCDDIIIGQTQPMQWVCKCRCGKECKGSGYGLLSNVRAFKWEVISGEAFCSLNCACKYRKVEVWKYHLELCNMGKQLDKRREIVFTTYCVNCPPHAKS